MDLPDCPYGAQDCPKINALKRQLEHNSKELDEVKTLVIELRTTVKNSFKVIGVLIGILTTLLGVIQL